MANNGRIEGDVLTVGTLAPHSATVTAFSSSTGALIFQANTDVNGHYRLTNIPEALTDVVAADGASNSKVLTRITPLGMAELNDFGLEMSGYEKWIGIAAASNGLMYCAPYDAQKILIIDPVAGTAILSNMGASINSTRQWRGIAKGSDGKLYCAPHVASGILIIDPVAGTATVSTMGAAMTSSGWSGIAEGADGMLYCAPYNATNILRINPGAGTATNITLGADLSGVAKWTDIALGGDNKLYCAPYNAADILVIDTAGSSASRGVLGATDVQFHGSIAKGSNGKLYLPPFGNNDVIIIDTGVATNSTMGSDFDESTEGFIGFWGAAANSIDSRIYAPPGYMQETSDPDAYMSILVVNPSASTALRTTRGANLVGAVRSPPPGISPDLWAGVAEGDDGNMYCAPYNAEHVLKIHPLSAFVFAFTDLTNQTSGATITSDPVTLHGVDSGVAITVTGTAGAKYSINGGSFVSTAGTVSSGDIIRAQVTCPGNAVVTIDGVSDSFDVAAATLADVLAIGTSDSPYVQLYSHSGDVFSLASNPFGSSIPDWVYSVAYKGTTAVDFFAVGIDGTNPRAKFFSGSGYTPATALSPTLSSSAEGVAISPDGSWLAVGLSVSPYVALYSTSTSAKHSDPSNLPTGQVKKLSFSPDGNYLAAPVGASPWLILYSHASGALTKLTDPGTMPASFGQCTAWSPDSVYLAVGTNTSTVLLYKHSGGTFTYLSSISGGSGSLCLGLSFSADGVYLAATGGTDLVLIKRSGDTFTEVSRVTYTAGSGQSCSFSNDGIYIGCAVFKSSPVGQGLYVAKRTGDSISLLSTPTLTSICRAVQFLPLAVPGASG